jgi:hypothetical protein
MPRISSVLPTTPEGLVSRRGPKPKYPILELEVGQSFLASTDLRNSLAALASYHGRRTGRVFRVVTMTSVANTIVFYRER